ncbi:hypothetical protein GCM10028807_51590 [Spirosoma daeguense]
MKFKRIFSLLAFLVGGGLLVGCWYSYSDTRHWLSTATKTQGEVANLRQQTSYDRKKRRDKTMYYPVIRFMSPSGENIEFESNVGSSPPSYDVGERVDVYYQQARPTDARTGDFLELWLLPLVSGFIGAVFVIIALLLFTRAGR